MMNENFNKRFMMWDRRTVVEKAKVECVKEVEQSEAFGKKADREYVDRLIKAMNELLLLKGMGCYR